MAERCKHGLLAAQCGACHPVPSPPPRHQAAEVRARAAGAVDPSRYVSRQYVVIHTNCRNAEHRGGFERLGPETEVVHVDGMPFLWAIRRILELAPNLKTLECIPSMLRKLHEDTHRKLLRERGVSIVGGHYRPESAWNDNRPRATSYERHRRFFWYLRGEQRVLFDELLAMGLESAQMAARYFCLAGEEYVPLYAISEMHGVKGDSLASQNIGAVIHYLDPNFKTGTDSMRRSRCIAQRVERLRPILRSAQIREERLRAAGGTRLPEGLPLWRFEVYLDLVRAEADGRLAGLAAARPSAWKAIRFRFGMDGESRYRTLAEVGAMLGNLTRERARQLEQRALMLLEIADEDGEVERGLETM